MLLRAYLKENSITVADFASRLVARGLEVSEFGVRKWVTGERIPRRDAMPHIVEETGGQVTPADFFDSGTPKPPAPETPPPEPTDNGPTKDAAA